MDLFIFYLRTSKVCITLILKSLPCALLCNNTTVLEFLGSSETLFWLLLIMLLCLCLNTWVWNGSNSRCCYLILSLLFVLPFLGLCCLLWFLGECGCCGFLGSECFWYPVRCGYCRSQIERVSWFWEQTLKNGVGTERGAKLVHKREGKHCCHWDLHRLLGMGTRSMAML